MALSPDQWEAVDRLYHAALARPVDARAAFLAEACAGDEALRREVESLLTQDASADGVLTRGAVVAAADLVSNVGHSALTGRRIGSYHIIARIGAGGMGEVFRARDTRLGRDVAIKILPRAFTSEPDRLARFEREARVLAALNHPHIAAIYGVEDAPTDTGAQLRALVLELVEGETLAERIARAGRRGGPSGSPMPIKDALDIARQIADALDAAHEKGIVHRDLKPANIKIAPQGIVKVLDFGLAKLEASGTGQAGGDVTEAPTITADDTREGLIVGTAAYMSPEQARGQAVDKRTDIWAFGCIFYEMLTGRAAFGAATISDTIAALIEREPDWQALPAATPSNVRRLLRRSLEKDVDRRLRDIGDVRSELDEALTARRPVGIAPRLWMLAGVATAVALTTGAVIWLRSERPVVPNRSEWVQLTNLDSVTQPALSPDGRMLAFIRGPSTFVSPGQLYVKQLPDGEPVQLTHDNLAKMGPAFSPDGSRIAYTVNDGSAWDTWDVTVLRGEPRRWLRNASGLTWISASDLLFSEVKAGIHMAIVRSPESRVGSRDLYVPALDDGMAHRSQASPDDKSVIVVEMGAKSVWSPCRLLTIDGSSSQPVGPSHARCTSAAWAPDGRWMYFTADAGDGFHIWRQRFPDGQPEQLTSGPTEEEGLSVAPDGKSLITSVGLTQRSVWFHDGSGERQVSLEGYAFSPLLSADGRKLCFRVTRGVASNLNQTPSELWVVDLVSGQTERVFRGQMITNYDLSRDDRIVASVIEDDGHTRLWLTSIDGRDAPRRIPQSEGDTPRFGRDGEILFRFDVGHVGYLGRIRENGENRAQIAEVSGFAFGTVSPDGEWLSSIAAGNAAVSVYSTSGQPSVRVFPYSQTSRLRWSVDGKYVYFSIQYGAASAFAVGHTYVLPLLRDSVLPNIPAGGFRNEAEIAALPGVEVIPYGDVAPGPSPSVYAFSRVTTTRNLYRIPLP